MERISPNSSGTGTWPALGGFSHHLAVLLLPPTMVLLVTPAGLVPLASNTAWLGLLLLSAVLPAAWLWARTRRLPAYQPRQPLAASMALAAICAALAAGLSAGFIAATGLAAGPNEQAIERALVQLPLWAQLGVFVMAGPLLEELVFRRLLLGRFLAAHAPVPGLVVTSVLFGLMHVPYLPGADPWFWAGELLLYSAMGAVLGAVYWRTRRLSAAFVAHALVNGLAMLLDAMGGNGLG